MLKAPVIDYSDGSTTIPVGFSRSGTGSGGVIFQDLPATTTHLHHGDDFINEGTVVIRSNYALGDTTGMSYTDPASGQTITTLGQTYINGTNAVLDFQGVNYTLPETINIAAGSLNASAGRTNFQGSLHNMYPEAQAVLNIGAWFEIDPYTDPNTGTVTNKVDGVAGYQKSGNGVLVVNVPTTIANNTSLFQAAEISNSRPGQVFGTARSRWVLPAPSRFRVATMLSTTPLAPPAF